MIKIVYLPILLLLFSCKNKIDLSDAKSEFLVEKGKFNLITDEFTNAYPEVFFNKKNFFLSVNSFNNSISVLDTNSKVIYFRNFKDIKVIDSNFKLTSAWFQNLDSIFVYSSNSNKIYLFNSKNDLLDSYNTSKKNIDKFHFYPLPEITTKQPPLVYNNYIYTTGFLGGEMKGLDIKKRYIISKIDKDTILFYGNYPSEYKNTDWGGFHFRHIYNTEIVDDKIYYSFPASSQIGVFNLENDSFYFIKALPEIKNLVNPVPSKFQFKHVKDKDFLPRLFYSQNSFGPLIYDKYKNVFYRFLLKPTEKKFLDRDAVGPQAKYLITYNRKFEMLGYNELAWEYSNFNFFVSEKGLHIQKIVQNDEKNMYFTIFNFNDNSKL